MFGVKNTLHFQKIDSTSAYLLRRRFELDNFTFLSADYQTDGKGRLTRVWHSNEGENLLFSFLIKDKTLLDNFSSLSIATAVCVIKVLNRLGVKGVSFKWPNDVYVNGKKICGILLSSISEGELDSLVIGVGLNVNQRVFELDTNYSTTAIINELNKKQSVKRVKRKLYREIIKTFIAIKNGDNSYLEVAKNNNYLQNQKVYAEVKGEKRLIKVIDINADNSLKVELNGEIITLNTGEITFHI